MIIRLLTLLVTIMLFLFATNIRVSAPQQPTQGPGGKDYKHNKVNQSFYGRSLQDWYWLFEPEAPKPDSAYIIVYWHGVTNHSPQNIYKENQEFIYHLVKKGYTIVVPVFQHDSRNIPTSIRLRNAATTLHAAFDELMTGNHVKPICDSLGRIIYGSIGYSLGGSMTSYTAHLSNSMELPPPKAICLLVPALGSGQYTGIPCDTKLLLISGDRDVNQKKHLSIDWYQFKHILPENKRLIVLRSDYHGVPKMVADHRFPVSGSNAGDSTTLNALDYFGVWKLTESLMQCAFSNTNCDFVFSDTLKICNMGNWSDGQPMKKAIIIGN